jgi:hypothetical protein
MWFRTFIKNRNFVFDSWEWTYEDNSVISNSFEVNLIDAEFTLFELLKCGISCENSFSFNLVRSTLPKIQEVKIQDASDNNYIEIITSGDFEYSIDGFNFQTTTLLIIFQEDMMFKSEIKRVWRW